MLGGPVVAHDADELHGGKIAGGVREEDRGAAQDIVAPLGGGFDTIQRYRSDNQQRHENFLNCDFKVDLA